VDIQGVVRRMVTGFSADLEALQLGVVDSRTPEPARDALASALVYIVEPIDLVPDVLMGMGMLDDAAIIRLGARGAVMLGAAQEPIVRLAREVGDLLPLFGDLLTGLERYLASIHPGNAISDPQRRMELWQKLQRRRETAGAVDLASLNDEAALQNMRTLLRERLGRLGVRLE
jgi:hypothetical protein